MGILPCALACLQAGSAITGIINQYDRDPAITRAERPTYRD
jgi:hypothetical protein